MMIASLYLQHMLSENQDNGLLYKFDKFDKNVKLNAA